MRSGPPAGCGWVSGYAGQRHYRADHSLPAKETKSLQPKEVMKADASTTIVAPPVRCSLGQLLSRSCVL